MRYFQKVPDPWPWNKSWFVTQYCSLSLDSSSTWLNDLFVVLILPLNLNAVFHTGNKNMMFVFIGQVHYLNGCAFKVQVGYLLASIIDCSI